MVGRLPLRRVRSVAAAVRSNDVEAGIRPRAVVALAILVGGFAVWLIGSHLMGDGFDQVTTLALAAGALLVAPVLLVQEHVRASRATARFRALIENSLDVTAILRVDGTIDYATPSLERVLGYTPAEVVGRCAFDLAHPDDAPRLQAIFADAGIGVGSTHVEEFRALHRDGSWKVMEAAGLNLRDDPAVRGVVVTARDIGARRALEERVHQSERLEAIGQLAGGIAHDFNNVLLVIRGYSTVLRSSLDDPKQLADVDEIAKAAGRAATLTRQLLAFGRRQVMQPTVLGVASVVRELEPLLRRAIPEDIELVLRLRDDVPEVLADPVQIEQVLVNLALNGRDAIVDGGAVTITVGEAAEPAAGVSPALSPGRYVTLAVADTGCGIAREALPHVFEPFFTTKGDGLGTGLGLASVYGIVAQSGGGIAVETRLGAGTTVTVYLPAVTERVTGVCEETPPVGGAHVERGSETILLVEDEEPVRQLVRRVLERAGYRVLAAARPSEAERLLEQETAVDLLLTDVVMPEMSGFDLAARIRRRQPALRTLFVSGYAHAAAQAASSIDGDALLLQKPFSPDQLGRLVRCALDGSRPDAEVA